MTSITRHLWIRQKGCDVEVDCDNEIDYLSVYKNVHRHIIAGRNVSLFGKYCDQVALYYCILRIYKLYFSEKYDEIVDVKQAVEFITHKTGRTPIISPQLQTAIDEIKNHKKVHFGRVTIYRPTI